MRKKLILTALALAAFMAASNTSATIVTSPCPQGSHLFRCPTYTFCCPNGAFCICRLPG
ncbi:MAG TPA: hypothetical protein VF173_12990 [Thermoanaerobaculia bacterium]|nr:hypothetical protein [Thermoanaerobaculia bacterium]